MHFIGKHDISRVLSFPRLIAALEAAHRRAKIEIRDTMLGTSAECYYVRNAVDQGRFFASKLITSFPGNPAAGALPAVQAVVVLFDARDGRPLAVFDGTEITCWRTAADSALGAKYLAREEAATLLVAGAGEMAPWLVRAHLSVRPSLTRVLCWNRTGERAQQLARSLTAKGVVAEMVADLEGARRTMSASGGAGFTSIAAKRRRMLRTSPCHARRESFQKTALSATSTTWPPRVACRAGRPPK
jgi:ornithine cyclodeaminase